MVSRSKWARTTAERVPNCRLIASNCISTAVKWREASSSKLVAWISGHATGFSANIAVWCQAMIVTMACMKVFRQLAASRPALLSSSSGGSSLRICSRP